MIRGLFVLLLFQCLGELLKLATGAILPGGVIGLLLLLAALALRGAVPDWLGKTSAALIGQLALLLLPPSVGLFFLGAQLRGQWPAVAGAIVFGTIATLLCSALVMRWLMRGAAKDNTP
jgi:holin-like protein